MEHDPVAMDPVVGEGAGPGRLEHLSIGDAPLLGALLLPGGEAPCPAVILCHGFPGHDDNMDIAHMLTRGGIASAVFHYSGSWGSGGRFSFLGMVEGVREVISHLRKEHAEYGIDPDRISLVGYSMGGWAAMMAAADDPSIRNIAFVAGFNLGLTDRYVSLSEENENRMLETLSSSMPPLSGCSPEGLMREIRENSKRFDLLNIASVLAYRSILMICGNLDETSHPAFHHDLILTALREAGAMDVEEVRIDAGHSFIGKRIELQDSLWKWHKDRI